MATPQEPAKQQQPAPEQIVEEDEFEEFEAEDWDARAEEPQNAALWEQDWDDDNIEDDFSQRLKAELQRQAAAQGSK
ncbi:26S proteasome complex subunit DSS1 [Micractinium conductrix]|uniref:26S proteasome complex subunit SEM1 n=1 Tax=Micractinium conductrix TaxID=554055 RepID=A0A2P6VIM9_9CHLO|nr:26S proteasome complex subunit DSS1 [Micractinium conductrix]|eukprot:PSC73955.1 26S proteasome complex subunit DSS1 [Micractinium conductrix]